MSQKKRSVRGLGTLVLALAVGAGTVVSQTAVAEDGEKLEGITFLGHMLNPGDLAPRASTQFVRIRIHELAGASQAEYLADILHRKGEVGLEQALSGRDVGFVQFGDRLPEPIAAAYVTEVGGNRHLTLLTQRTPSRREIWDDLRSGDYRFRVIEVDLDANNRGGGTMSAAARFRKDKHGDFNAENLGVWPWRIMDLKPL